MYAITVIDSDKFVDNYPKIYFNFEDVPSEALTANSKFKISFIYDMPIRR